MASESYDESEHWRDCRAAALIRREIAAVAAALLIVSRPGPRSSWGWCRGVDQTGATKVGPQTGRYWILQQAQIGVKLLGVPRAGDDRRHRRMSQRELQ